MIFILCLILLSWFNTLAVTIHYFHSTHSQDELADYKSRKLKLNSRSSQNKGCRSLGKKKLSAYMYINQFTLFVSKKGHIA